MPGKEAKKEGLPARIRILYEKANQASGGILGLAREALEGFGEARGGEAAAGMAYYTLLSLFPLLIALVAAGSFFLDRASVFQQVVDTVVQAIPISQDLIERNLRQVLELRGAVGFSGLVAALWSATGAFSILTRNINRAWDAPPRSFLENRLVALAMVGSLALLLAISWLLGMALGLLSRFQVPLVGLETLYGTPLWTLLSNLAPWFVSAVLLVALYRWVPNAKVQWRGALGAALVVGLVWQIASNAFAWFLGSDLARYHLVYGSLGAVVALLFWIYLSAWLVLFGAHLSAAVTRRLSEEGAL